MKTIGIKLSFVPSGAVQLSLCTMLSKHFSQWLDQHRQMPDQLRHFAQQVAENQETAKVSIYGWLCETTEEGDLPPLEKLRWVNVPRPPIAIVKKTRKKKRKRDPASSKAAKEKPIKLLLRSSTRVYFACLSDPPFIGHVSADREEQPYPMDRSDLFPNTLYTAMCYAMVPDITRLWLTYLEPEELIQCGQVCRQWREMCSDPKLWKRWDRFFKAVTTSVFLHWNTRSTYLQLTARDGLSQPTIIHFNGRYLLSYLILLSRAEWSGPLQYSKESIARRSLWAICPKDSSSSMMVCRLNFGVDGRILLADRNSNRCTYVSLTYLGQKLITGIRNLLPISNQPTVYEGYENQDRRIISGNFTPYVGVIRSYDELCLSKSHVKRSSQ